MLCFDLFVPPLTLSLLFYLHPQTKPLPANTKVCFPFLTLNDAFIPPLTLSPPLLFPSADETPPRDGIAESLNAPPDNNRVPQTC